MGIWHVDDAGDDRLRDYRNLSDGELMHARGAFVAEGRLVVRRLLAGRLRTRSVMVTRAGLDAIADALAGHDEVPVYVVPQATMNGVTGFNLHRGCLAIGERPPEVPWSVVADAARRILVLERVANADNVGSLFRNAAALGADAVLLSEGCADPLYRKAIRTSMASALAVPFATLSPWPGALDAMRASGFATVALTPAAAAEPLPRVMAAVCRQRVALVLGHEGDGLTPHALAACAHRARIAMAPGVDSINVATAGAIALYALAAATAAAADPAASGSAAHGASAGPDTGRRAVHPLARVAG